MDRDKIYSYRSELNLHHLEQPYQHAKNLKSMASEVFDNRAKTYNQLQKFYLPVMKKAFEDSKTTNPSLKSPDEFIFSSKIFEIKQNQDRLLIQSLKKEIQIKNNKILKLENDIKGLEKNLLIINPSPLSNQSNEPYMNLKKMQSYLNIKNDQSLFRSKTRATSLLQQFNISFPNIQILNHKTSQSQIIDYLFNKLQPIAQQYRSLLNGHYQKRNQLENKYLHLEYQNKQLQQSITLIRNVEISLRQQLEHVKDNWNKANNKIINLDKQIEQKDVQLYKLRKLLEEKKESINFINKSAEEKVTVQSNLRRDHELQANQLSLLYQASCIQNLELKKELEEKRFEISELKNAYQFRIEQVDKLNRVNVVLKARYEPEQKKDILYSPRAYYERQIRQISFSNDTRIGQERQKQRQKANFDKFSTLPTGILKRQSNDSDFSTRPVKKLRLQKVAELKNQIEQKQHLIWKLSHPHNRLKAHNTPQIERAKYEIELIKEQLYKLQDNFQTYNPRSN